MVEYCDVDTSHVDQAYKEAGTNQNPPDGEYDMFVSECGTYYHNSVPCARIVWEVESGPCTGMQKTVMYTLDQKNIWKFKKDAVVLFPNDFEDRDYVLKNLRNIEGAPFRVRLVSVIGKNGKTYQNLHFVTPDEKPKPKPPSRPAARPPAQRRADQPPPEDEIPF